jgi:RNA-directed DNA polymerase
MTQAKSFSISKKIVWEAYERVKANQGAAGVDSESIEAFEKDLKNNLYKIWNRMSSGTYFPPPVRTVAIPKKDGGERRLGIPTVASYCTSVGRILGCMAVLNSARVAHPRS